MRCTLQRCLYSLVALVAATTAFAATPDNRDIDVQIRRQDEAIVVDVSMRVAASPEQAWSVLTDYDHMAEYVSDLAESHVLRRDADRLEVEQKSLARFGLIEIRLENVREIVLTPPLEIRSKLIRGDMKTSSFTTHVVAEGDSTRVINHGSFVPDRWIPPLIGIAVLESETRKQFGELRAEILRRAARGTSPP